MRALEHVAMATFVVDLVLLCFSSLTKVLTRSQKE